MISNPFARKPKTPIDHALEAFDGVRSDAADYAATIRDTAADIAETLTEIGPPAAPKGRKLPIIAAVLAAGLGIAYLVRSKMSGSVTTESPQPEAPKTPSAPAAPAAPAAPSASGAPKHSDTSSAPEHSETPSAPMTPAAPETPKEPQIVVSNGQPEPSLEPTPAEEAKETKAATPESEAAKD